MSLINIEEAKLYLRVDSPMENDLIGSLLLTAEKLTADVARLTASEWEELSEYTADNQNLLTIRQEVKSRDEALQMKELLRVGVLYALGYLYEHREEADHHDLVMTMRNLLFAVREGVF